MHRPRWAAVSAAAFFALSGPIAEGAPKEVVAPAGAGQQALAVALTGEGLAAKVCANAAGCSATSEGAQRYAAKALAGAGSLEIVRLEGGRHVVRAFASSAEGEYDVVLAAPLAGEPATPKRLWSGWVGRRRGGQGEARTLVFQRQETPRGTRLTFAKQRQDNQICGRATTIQARALDASTLSLKPAPVMRVIDDAEIAKAPVLTAEVLAGDEPGRLTAYRLLRARGSGAPGAERATDGDRGSAWSENAPDDGRGEFITVAVDGRVPLTALDFTLSPVLAEEADEDRARAVPRGVLIVTNESTSRVRFPSTARGAGDAVYRVKLEPPLQTACLSVVLDGAHAAPGVRAPVVTIAEIVARTGLDTETPPELVKRLDESSGVADPARALLLSLPTGVEAAIAGYHGLTPPGRERARGVIDAADCSRKSAFYRELLGRAQTDNERRVAEDRVRRCSRSEGPDGLVAAARAAEGDEQKRLARELAMLYPAAAVPVLVDLLTDPDDATRRVYRQFLAGVANKPKSRSAFAAKLEPATYRAMSLVTRIDVLRALGAALPHTPGGAAAFDSLVAEPPDFRTRYLLLGPSAELAQAGHGPARDFLRAALVKDESGHIRAQAARVAQSVPELTADLVRAGADPAVRVRQAALQSLAARRAAPAGLVPVAAARLRDDPWTFVRTSAVRALGSVSDDRSVNGRLAKAVSEDASPDVRRAAVRALGRRGATQHKEVIEARVDAKFEAPAVRAEAVLALGRLCDREHLDDWTDMAVHAAFPTHEGERTLGLAALASLGRVHPPDLKERLAPLLGPKVPREVREGARRALATEPACR